MNSVIINWTTVTYCQDTFACVAYLQKDTNRKDTLLGVARGVTKGLYKGLQKLETHN